MQANSRRSQRTSSAETRQRLVDAALELFTEHGLNAVSVRRIAEVAGVNQAMVNYHFGSKDGLIEEVVRTCAASHLAERMHALSQAKCLGNAINIKVLLRIYVEPLLRRETWTGQGNRFSRLHSALLSERPEQVETIIARAYNTVNLAFLDEFCALLPGLTRQTVIWRFYSIIGALFFLHMRPAPPGMMSISGGVCDPSDADEALRQLLPVFEAILLAPPPESEGLENNQTPV